MRTFPDNFKMTTSRFQFRKTSSKPRGRRFRTKSFSFLRSTFIKDRSKRVELWASTRLDKLDCDEGFRLRGGWRGEIVREDKIA